MGLFWGLLHTPPSLALRERYSGNPGVFVVTIVAISIVMTWVFANSGGNVFLSGVMVHAVANAASQAGLGGDARLVVFGLTALVLIARYGEALRPAGSGPPVYRRPYRVSPRPTDSRRPPRLAPEPRP